VSHDLRAPLRHIDGFSKILVEEAGTGLDATGREYLAHIRKGAQRMGCMVDDLLNLARIVRPELSRQLTGLRSLVDEVLADLKPEMEGRQIELRIRDLPFLDCDRALLKQVFANLLSNAIKFTRPRTQAVIEVGWIGSPGHPVVFVRDNGVGFSMKYADKLFGVFQRLHRSEDFEGTGIGLATVQRIIHKHGGRVWAEAELDQGATFYFTLEAREAGPPQDTARGVPADIARG
jgi:light-regulated signal transduction histidine kinase (bacteriophytochrome)